MQEGQSFLGRSRKAQARSRWSQPTRLVDWHFVDIPEVHHGEQDEQGVRQQREVSKAERITKEIDVEEKEKREEEARKVGNRHTAS